MSTPKPYPPLELLRERLDLDVATGTLTWKNGPRKGKPAASEKGRGYLMLRLDGRALFVHRVVFILATGSDPHPLHIDHINGNRADNRQANLRAVTNAQNIAHRTRQNRNNTSGHPGVYWHRTAGKWAACIKRNRTTHHLGLFDQIEEAVAARQSFTEKQR